MEHSDDNAFSLLARPVLEAVRERGFTAPTEPQAQAIPKIMAGVAQLKVPLLAEVGVGPNWDKAH